METKTHMRRGNHHSRITEDVTSGKTVFNQKLFSVARVQIQNLYSGAKIVSSVIYSLKNEPDYYKENCKCEFIRKYNIASDKQHLELTGYLKYVSIFLCSGRNVLKLYWCTSFKHIWRHSK